MLKKYLSFMLFIFTLSVMTVTLAEPVNQLFRQSGDPILGNPKGKITIVEFFDYQCSHCVNVAPVIAAIIKSNPDVRVVFKEFPIRGPLSDYASRAALAANKQGKYAAVHDALLEANGLDESTINSIAKSAGLNMKKWQKDLNSEAISNQIKNNLQLGENINVTGTPAFFIGKTNAKDSKEVLFVLGEMSQTELQNAVDQAKK